MRERATLLDHRHIPRAGIATKSTDHSAGTSPMGRKPCKGLFLLGATIPLSREANQRRLLLGLDESIDFFR